MTKLVLSPLATLRFRLGQLVLTSPISFRQIVLPDGLLPFLAFLKIPRTEQEWTKYAEQRQIDLLKLQSFVGVLQDRKILMELSADDEASAPPASEETGTSPKKWWDKKDAAHFDIRTHQIVQVLYGNSHSLQANFPLDRNKRPIPWFSYPAIDYLETLDLSRAAIFEFGSGGSTLYLEQRCRSIVSVENNAAYLQKIEERSSGKAEFKLRENETAYTEAILEDRAKYDMIIIDSIPDFRQSCVAHSLTHVADGGIIILDDAAMYPAAYKMLLTLDDCPIDFIGLAPMEDVVQTTSFFFHRGGQPAVIKKNSPLPLGSAGDAWNL